MNDEQVEEPQIEETSDGDGYASQASPFIERDVSGQNFQIARELFHGSNKPEEYLPRTRIDGDEIGVLQRIVLRSNRVTKGFSDYPMVTAVKYNARMGLGGAGRAEVVRVATATPERRRSGRGEGIMNRARDVHPQGGRQGD